MEETLEALTALVEQRKLRSIGCSNWSAWHVCEAPLLIQENDLAPLVSIQPPYNPKLLIGDEIDGPVAWENGDEERQKERCQ